MIAALVEFALNNRFMVLALTILLLVWGVVSFHNLPVEAYPDVANNYVTVITQWPGRAAEEVEQQVTIPIETQVNGLPHLEHLRSVSLFGLSSVTMIFDDSSQNDWNRQKVLERLGPLTLPGNLQPAIGPDYSPVGQIYWYTLRSTNPQVDLMQLKSIEDWVLAAARTVPRRRPEQLRQLQFHWGKPPPAADPSTRIFTMHRSARRRSDRCPAPRKG